jgi:hypothetical protein
MIHIWAHRKWFFKRWYHFKRSLCDSTRLSLACAEVTTSAWTYWNWSLAIPMKRLMCRQVGGQGGVLLKRSVAGLCTWWDVFDGMCLMGWYPGGIVQLVLFPHHNLRSNRERYLFERCPHDQLRMLCKGTILKLTRPSLHNAMVTVGNGELVYGGQFWHIFLEKNLNSSKLFHLRMLNYIWNVLMFLAGARHCSPPGR